MRWKNLLQLYSLILCIVFETNPLSFHQTLLARWCFLCFCIDSLFPTVCFCSFLTQDNLLSVITINFSYDDSSKKSFSKEKRAWNCSLLNQRLFFSCRLPKFVQFLLRARIKTWNQRRSTLHRTQRWEMDLHGLFKSFGIFRFDLDGVIESFMNRKSLNYPISPIHRRFILSLFERRILVVGLVFIMPSFYKVKRICPENPV